MDPSTDAHEITLLRERMVRDNPNPKSDRFDIYQSEVRSNKDLDSVRAYAKLLFDPAVSYPRGIRNVIAALRQAGHKEVAPVITSDHINHYRSGMLMFSRQAHAAIYPHGMTARETIMHMQAVTLAYTISDDKTRAFIDENLIQLARELWDEDYCELPEVLAVIARKMVAGEDSISAPVIGGVL
jgi:hypothetical protein